MRPISEVVMPDGCQVGVCTPCLNTPACAVCRKHPQETGKPGVEVHGVSMCPGCAKVAQKLAAVAA